MRVGLYARVSTRDQHPENQLDVLRRWALDAGHEIVDEYVEHVSAVARRRPEWERLERDWQGRRVDAIAVVRIDRAFRDARQALEYLEILDARGITFVAVTQPIDTLTPAGRLVFTFGAAFAEMERRTHIERVQEGLDRAVRQGTRLGRPRVRLTPQAAVDALAEHGSARAAADALGVNRETFRRRLAQATQKGLAPAEMREGSENG